MMMQNGRKIQVVDSSPVGAKIVQERQYDTGYPLASVIGQSAYDYTIDRQKKSLRVWEYLVETEVVGHALAEDVYRDGEQVVEFGGLAVAAQHQRQGIARELLDAFFRFVEIQQNRAIVAAWSGSPSHLWFERHPSLIWTDSALNGNVQVFEVDQDGRGRRLGLSGQR